MEGEIIFMLQEAEHFPSKPTTDSKLRGIRVIKEKLNHKQHSMFKETCFGKLLHIEEFQFCGQLVHNLLLRQIQSSDPDELWFAIPDGQPFRFSIQEFCLVTGLRCDPYPEKVSEDLPKGSKSFFNTMLNGSKQTTKSLHEVFLSATSENDMDMVKLALLYFLEIVLLGKDPKVQISMDHIQLLDDIEAFNQFPWGRLSYEMTLGSLKMDMRKKAAAYQGKQTSETVGQQTEKKLKQKQENNPIFYHLRGFPFAFQVWACEALPTIGKELAIKSSSKVPRILSWRSFQSRACTSVATLLTRDDVVVLPTLQPTAAEAKEAYCRYFLGNEESDNNRSSENKAENDDGDNIECEKITAALPKRMPTTGRQSCQACHDRKKDHEDQLQAIHKQLQLFQQQTNDRIDKMQAEMHQKFDMIISFLFSNIVRPASHTPSPAKPTAGTAAGPSLHKVQTLNEKDLAGGDMQEDIQDLAGGDMQEDIQEEMQEEIQEEMQEEVRTVDAALPTAQGERSVDANPHIEEAVIVKTERLRRTPRKGKQVVGSPCDLSSPSVVEIPKPTGYERKRKRKKGRQITSPFEPLGAKPKKRTTFRAFPPLAVRQLGELEAWMNRVAPGPDRVWLMVDYVNRDWFTTLYTPDAWLGDEHIDIVFHALRKRTICNPSTNMLQCTSVGTIFQQNLWSRYNRYKQTKEDVWDDDDVCIRWTDGSERCCHPWVAIQKVLIPVNYHRSHWALADVDLEAQSITLYDSLKKHSRNWKSFLDPLHTMLPLLLQKIDYCKNNAGTPEDIYKKEGWTLSRCEEAPQQAPGSGDCGIFVIKWAEHLMHGVDIQLVTHAHVPYFRKQLALALWNDRCIDKPLPSIGNE